MKGPMEHLNSYKADTVAMPADLSALLLRLRELDRAQTDGEAALEACAGKGLQEVQRAVQHQEAAASTPRPPRKKAGAGAAAAKAAAAAAGPGPAQAYAQARASVKQQADEVVRISEQKVKLAQELYDYVDRRIVSLQQSNAGFQDEIFLEQQRLGLDIGKTAREALGLATSTDAKDKVKALMRKKSYKTAELLEIPGEGAILADQREPTYCYCNRVSFGEMIACDNPECAIEWFHYECVGLPPGFQADEWLCKECVAAAAAAAGGGGSGGGGGGSAAAAATGAEVSAVDAGGA